MDSPEIVDYLRSLANPEKIKGIARFGIPVDKVLGISMPQLRTLAREIGNDQNLANELWSQPIHEAKLLATIISEPKKFGIEKADSWMKDLYSWDTCDQFCLNLLVKTPYALDLPERWATESGEYQKRASLALIAVIAVHKKKLPDQEILAFKPILERAATDNRNFVKKATNWAIRQIGKRNESLRLEMLDFCEELLLSEDKAASWIARDAIRELSARAKK